MAIDRIPGVGPTNADIATAVAAPSAATIAAAVAAPSAATIAAAVAAPSSSTIATAVAAAVPTLSQINTSVATNAPSPNGWTVISTNNANSSFGTYTWSGLSGYKAYKLVFSTTVNTQCAVYVRVNGISTSTYTYVGGNLLIPNTSFSTANSTQAYIGNTVDGFIHGEMLFPDASTGNPKIMKGYAYYRNAGNDWLSNSLSSTQSTAAITSITFAMSGSFFTTGSITLLGAN